MLQEAEKRQETETKEERGKLSDWVHSLLVGGIVPPNMPLIGQFLLLLLLTLLSVLFLLLLFLVNH